MVGTRSRYGLLVSALGAILLAVSVFLPWYGLSFTASGIALVQQSAQEIASQFGNASLQAYVGAQHASLSALAGQEFVAVSAHQVLKDLNVLLLALAGLAMLAALMPLARGGAEPEGGGAAIALLGALATVCVAYRIVHPPSVAGDLVALSVREGAWLALVGSLAMVAGGLWPRPRLPVPGSSERSLESAWSGLSGWTPQG
ncbi:MAG TPA: hypothetical protein VGW98_12865 [Solirubrobacteraceae bacterium]|jgi:hypothetical protein|nr:hypothetical protein [Solirubrobacteraceae bacterium]